MDAGFEASIPPWHAVASETVLELLGATAKGLREDEAERRLAEYGPNLLLRARTTSAIAIFVRQCVSVVVALLVTAAAVAWWSGDRLDAAVIAAVVVLNVGLGFAVELRARRAMEALLALDVPRAMVVRNGYAREIDAAFVVPGDVLVLEAGRAIPADARLLHAIELRTHEASLTGEAFPAEKSARARLAVEAPLAERVTMVYKGTTAVNGSAHAVVVATGPRTEVGRIGSAVAEVREERGPFERRLEKLGARLAFVAMGLGVLFGALAFLRGERLGDVIQTGVAIAVAAVPEGLPAIITVAFAIGVHRMARAKAIVRRLPTVESLGAATLICTDKTGTLTAGTMTVTTLWLAGRTRCVEEAAAGAPFATLMRAAVLANRAEIENGALVGDPTEGALLDLAARTGVAYAMLRDRWRELAEVPFSSDRMLMATLNDDGGRLCAHVKGAPEAILARCSRYDGERGVVALDEATRRRIGAANEEFAERGLRVLAVAVAPDVRPERFSDLNDLVFVGLIAMEDPAADGVRETIAAVHGAGIRVVMITGDQARTAKAVAATVGIPDDAVFSRVSPQEKLRIVDALRARGEVVAMLGDGINDAAALRRADVGVAMGRRGTDFAKEVAGIVLADDRFATIGEAVREGRVIGDNVRRFIAYLAACNVAEVLVLLVPALVLAPPLLLPLQILWLNLVTDTFPALALALEPAANDVMHRPPASLFRLLDDASWRAVGIGALLLAGGTAAAYGLAHALLPGGGHALAATVCFETLALAQLAYAFAMRRIRGTPSGSNPALTVAVLATAVVQIALPVLESTRRVFDLAPLSLAAWAIVALCALAPASLVLLYQAVRRRAGASTVEVSA